MRISRVLNSRVLKFERRDSFGRFLEEKQKRLRGKIEDNYPEQIQ